MLDSRHRGVGLFSGLTFLGLGMFLFYRGITNFIIAGKDFFAGKEMGVSFLGFLNSFINSPEHSILLLVCVALSLGFLMGHFMLKKVFKNLHTIFFFLFPILILISFGLSFFSSEIRGFIDFVIASGLISRAFIAIQEVFKKKDFCAR